jgi:hypothetical protein
LRVVAIPLPSTEVPVDDGIHEVAHGQGSIVHLRADGDELDRLFHLVEDVIVRLARTRQIGPQALSHFRAEMADVSRPLHHLREDLDAMRGPIYDADGHHGGVFLTRLGVNFRS